MRRFADRHVGAVGLGCMGMSWAYSESERDDRRSVELIREAVDLGVTFLDTSDVYGAGHNEALVGTALRGIRDRVVLGTKVGLVADPPTRRMRRDGRPEHVRAAVEASLRRLGTDVIDLYYLHRLDPNVLLAETWGAMAELVAAGKVRHLGLSEVTVAQAGEAHRIHPVAAIQSELSLWTRDALGVDGARPAGGAPADAYAGRAGTTTAVIAGAIGARAGTGAGPGAGRSAGTDDAGIGTGTGAGTVDAGTGTGAGAGADTGPGNVVGWCAEHGAAFVPFSPLGRGFLTGAMTDAGFEETDFRRSLPRFQEEAMRQNMRIVEAVRTVAERHGATPAQVAIAWTLAQGGHVIPIPGTKKRRYLHENTRAAGVDLTDADLAELDAVPPPVGARY